MVTPRQRTDTGGIRSVVIAGGGTAGWMTAAAFANRVMQFLNCSVTLIESAAIGTVGVGEATVPPIRLFNRITYGIDEAELLRHIQGTFKLGIRFENWGRLGDSYFHPFGSLGVPNQGDLIPFQHYWMHARRLGDEADLDAYNIAATAAAAGRFGKPTADRSARLPQLAYAYHLDAALYAAYLRRYAEQRGVRRIEGRIVDVTLRSGDGFIEAITLAGGRRINADLYIDCTGFRGLLIEQALGAGYEDWSRLLPCDRAVAVAAEQPGPRPPFTRAIARQHGWQWHIPLQHRSGNGYVYCSDYCSDAEATELLLAHLPGKPLAEPHLLRFVTGRRKRFWIGNCVAIGLAAGFLEPLESTSIYLIQDAILRLLSLFPNAGLPAAKIDLFNRLTAAKYEQIRDFLVLHYYANERTDAPFWAAVANLRIPDSLQQRIDLFRRSAHAHAKDTHSFSGDEGVFGLTSWVTVMLGQNIVPQDYHPLLAATPDDGRLRAYLAGIRGAIGKAVGAMPTHDEYVARYCPAVPAPPTAPTAT